MRYVVLAGFRDPLRLAEAYFQGGLDVEGNLYTVLEMKDYLQTLNLSAYEKADFLFTALFLGRALAFVHSKPQRRKFLSLRPWRAHSKGANRQAIAFHYDVSNAFYRLWLDERMICSCAYFETPDESLDQAQCNKLEHICRKLRLKPGERLLDIGCGWGALIRWAASHNGAYAHGITLSREPYEHCQADITAAGLQDRITVEFKDYRDLEGESRYDKVVSVGMFEHVGLRNLPHYFAIVRRLLKPDGL